MGIKLGNLDISAFKVGSGDCSIYLGTTKLWPTEEPAFTGKFKAWYNDGTTYTADCDSASALTTSTTKSSGYQYSAMTDAVIGDCVTSLTSGSSSTIGAFGKCTNLTSVTIGNNVTYLGNYAFFGCGFATIEIPNSVTSIGSFVFASCSSLTSITIPNSVTNIGNQVFHNCSGLISCTIGNNVASLPSGVFSGCSSLTNINIPSSVASISNNTFNLCTSLSSVTFNNGLSVIGSSAFGGCISLTNIVLPPSITSIGSAAFYKCSGITGITIEATTPPTLTSSDALSYTNDCPIYVPSASVSAYKTAWSSYASRIQAIPSSKQWVSYSEADSVPNYGVYGIKFQSSANHEYVEYPSYIQFVDENYNYMSIYYDGGDWYLETSSGAEEITFDGETDYATIIFDDYGVGAATIDEMALLSTGMPFDMQLYELN